MKRSFSLFAAALGVIYTSHAQLTISEVQSSNQQTVFSDNFTEPADWVEIYNSTDSTVELGDYFLSDKRDNLLKWRIPSGILLNPTAYKVFWCDGKNIYNHTNFGLSNNGETIYLSDSLQTIIDSLEFPKLLPDYSYGKDQNNVLGYYFLPSPGSKNNSPLLLNPTKSRIPVFEIDSVYYDGVGFRVSFDTTESCEILYTFSGTTPNYLSGKYDSIFYVDSNTVLKAISICGDQFPSDVVTQTIFPVSRNNLPIISVSTNSSNIYDRYVGIYVPGDNGKKVNGITANYWQDWERPVVFEYFKDGKRVYVGGAGIEMNGERRNMNQRSMRLTARGKYGNSTFEYPFFEGKDLQEYDALVLRNGGYNEYRFTLMRDGLGVEIGKGYLNMDYTEYQPTVLYINGIYWGIYNLREKINEQYLEFNNGADPKNIDVVEFEVSAVEGDTMEYAQMREYARSHDLSDSSAYAHVAKQIDLDNYIDYQILETYIANTDWPRNNNKRWKEKGKDHQWRWIVFDIDAGLGNWVNASHKTLTYILKDDLDPTDKFAYNHPENTLLFRRMMKNESFNIQFLKRYNYLLQTAFDTVRTFALTDSIKRMIEPEIPYHIQKWGTCYLSRYTLDGCPFKTYEEWLEHTDKIYDFLRDRNHFVIDELTALYHISGRSNLVVKDQDSTKFKVKIDQDFVLKNEDSCTLFNDIQYTVNIYPEKGQKLQRAIIGNDTIFEKQFVFTPTQHDTLFLEFVADTQSTFLDTLVSDTLYLKYSPYFVSGHLIVDTFKTLYIENGVEILFEENSQFEIHGNVFSFGNDSLPILLNADFDHGFTSFKGMVFINSDSSFLSKLKIENATAPIYKDHRSALEMYNSKVRLKHIEILNNYREPVFGRNVNLEIVNAQLHSEVSGDFINIKGGYVFLDSVLISGNSQKDTDAIDLDGVDSARLNRIYIKDFFGSNSDGIDIGEQAKNVIISNAYINKCNDKGVSIGQGSEVKLYNSIITRCELGIGIKDSNSVIVIDHSTFFSNQNSLASYEKNVGAGAGILYVYNSIISFSVIHNLYTDKLGKIVADNNLLQDDSLGVLSIYNRPYFVDPVNENFNLLDYSPAKNRSNGNHLINGIRQDLDLGAKLNTTNNRDFSLLKIVEVMTNPDSSYSDNFGEFEDWIQVRNFGNEAIDLGGLTFSDDIQNPFKDQLPFPKNNDLVIEANESFLFYADDDKEQGANHLGIKLSKNGDFLGWYHIQNKVVWLIDSMHIPALKTGESYGKYLDFLQTIVLRQASPFDKNIDSIPYVYFVYKSKVNVLDTFEIEYTVLSLSGDTVKMKCDCPEWLMKDSIENIYRGVVTDSVLGKNSLWMNWSGNYGKDSTLIVFDVEFLVSVQEEVASIFPASVRKINSDQYVFKNGNESMEIQLSTIDGKLIWKKNVNALEEVQFNIQSNSILSFYNSYFKDYKLLIKE